MSRRSFAPCTASRTMVLSIMLGVGWLTSSASTVGAQTAPGSRKWVDSVRVLIEAGMGSGAQDGLDPAIALADRVLTVVPNDAVLQHYKGYALYRKSNLMQGRGAKADELKPVLEEADRALEESARTLDWAETFALRSSVYGQLIAVNPNPLNAMRLGPKADKEMERAVALGPGNPRVFLLRGVGSIFKPSLFGGGLDKAEKDLRKAIDLFPADKPNSPAPSWGYSEAWAWLGQVYAKQDRAAEARAAYNKALELQPDYGWVRYVLLPDLDKKKR